MRRCSAELLKCIQLQFSAQVGNTVVFINSVVLNCSFRSHSFAKVACSAYIFDVTFAIETMPFDVSMVVLYIYINMNICISTVYIYGWCGSRDECSGTWERTGAAECEWWQVFR